MFRSRLISFQILPMAANGELSQHVKFSVTLYRNLFYIFRRIKILLTTYLKTFLYIRKIFHGMTPTTCRIWLLDGLTE